MLTRTLIALALCCHFTHAADTPPSDASIKQLLEVAQARKLVDTLMSQMDTIMKNALQAATEGQPVSQEVQKTFDQCRTEVVSILREQFTWDKLEPMYIRIYKKSLSQQEVDGMIAFYRTPTGQAMINKMPVIMQNSMNEVNQMMGPMMQRIQRMQQDVIAEIQAEKTKKGSS
jgi:hypothetical protein